MARPRHADPSIGLHVQLPQSLVAELELYCFDPISNRMRYGMRRMLVERALRELFAKLKEENASDTGSENTGADSGDDAR